VLRDSRLRGIDAKIGEAVLGVQALQLSLDDEIQISPVTLDGQALILESIEVRDGVRRLCRPPARA
jgi:hypothetical protein